MTTSPFKFLDSYTREDIGSFFGRERETGELFRLCFTAPILVVYGGSGTGKTSLVQCGLQSKFNESDWLPVLVRRSGDLLASLGDAVAANTLTPIKSTDLGEQVANLYLDHFKPVYFLFDQFEELFIFGTHAESEAFFTAIKKLLEKERNAHVIFIVREEYLAELTRYERIIPGLIENRYRVERMARGQAMNVVEQLCATNNITCGEGFSAAMVDRLNPEGQGVELSYLQVYLDRCWRTRKGDEPFSIALLERIGYVDDLLGAFLDEQVADTPDPQRAENLLKAFVSDQGTKRQLTAGEAHEWVNAIGTAMEPAEVDRLLQVFVTKRLLKDRDERGRYELLHDALARQIFQRITRAEQELIEVRQFVQQAFGQHVKRGVKLTANDLTYLRPFKNQLHLKGEVLDFVEEAFGEEQRHLQRSKRNRKRTGIAAVVAFIALGFFTWGKMKELYAERRVFASHQQAEKAGSLLNEDHDPMQALAYARSAFLLDSNEASIKALTNAYNRGYNEIARYDGNLVLWTPSMDHYLIGDEDKGIIRIYDRSFELLAEVDSLIIDDRCKFVTDSFFVCPTRDHHVMVLDLNGEVRKSVRYRDDGSVYNARTDLQGRTYFGLQCDSLLHLFTSDLRPITRHNLRELGFVEQDVSYNWRLQLWDDQWCFNVSASDITFQRYNEQGLLPGTQVLHVRNKAPNEATRRIRGDGSISCHRTESGFEFFDEEGLFTITRTGSEFAVRHLVTNEGTDKTVYRVWCGTEQIPAFVANSNGRNIVRWIDPVLGAREWKAPVALEGKSRREIQIIADPYLVGDGPEGSIILDMRTGEDRRPGFTFAGRVGGNYAFVRTAGSKTTIQLRDARDPFKVRATTLNVSGAGAMCLRPIGDGYLVLRTALTTSGPGGYFILDSLLTVHAVLPDLGDLHFQVIHVQGKKEHASHIEFLAATSQRIYRVGPSNSMINGGYMIPPERVGVIETPLSGGRWMLQPVDSLYLCKLGAELFCMQWNSGSIALLQLKGNTFIKQQEHAFGANGLGAPTVVACKGEQKEWNLLPGQEYWLLDGGRVRRMDLRDVQRDDGWAQLRRSGTVVYETANGGLARWDSSGSRSLADTLRRDSLLGWGFGPLVYRSGRKVLRLDDHGRVEGELNAAILQPERRMTAFSIYRIGTEDLLVSAWGEHGVDDPFNAETVWLNDSTGAIHCQWKGGDMGSSDEVLNEHTMRWYLLSGVRGRSWVTGDRNEWASSASAMIILDLKACQADTIGISSLMMNEVEIIDDRSVLLKRSKWKELTEDGFTVLVDGRFGSEYAGYAAAIGEGMILTNHRYKQKFERYPVLPSAILHMIDKEKVYGGSYTRLGPKFNDLGRLDLSWLMLLLGVLIGYLVVRWWKRRARRKLSRGKMMSV